MTADAVALPAADCVLDYQATLSRWAVSGCLCTICTRCEGLSREYRLVWAVPWWCSAALPTL